jgi:hypothetical protein
MNQECFWTIVQRIAPDPIFHNDSRNPQAPVAYQLLLTLKRLGMEGNGVSLGQTASFFSVAGT